MGYRTSQFVFAVVLITTGLLQASTATAQTYDQLKKWCYGDATDDQTIQGCNAVIKAGRATPANIATAFGNRGLAYNNKKQYDRAIEDLDEAIRLNPSYTFAFNNRGGAYKDKGQDDRAIQDYDQAIRLDPLYTAAFTNRGLAYEGTKDFEKARTDFRTAISVSPKYDNGEWAQKTARERLEALKDK
jgi:tetratricopeptide (TPR) repeat protein